MKQTHLPFIATILYALISSCSKSQTQQTFQPTPRVITEYQFENTTDRPLTFDIYQTRSDYNNDSNVYINFIVPAHTRHAISVDSIKENTVYFVDWYDSSFTYTNWGFRDSFTLFTPSNIDTAFSTKNVPIPNNVRLLFLNGHSAGTKWIAINAFGQSQNTLGYISIWNQYHNDKYCEFTFLKDYTSIERYYNTRTFDTTELILPYGTPQVNPIIIAYTLYNMIKSNFTSSAPWNYQYPATNSIDTILIRDLNNGTSFLSMIKM